MPFRYDPPPPSGSLVQGEILQGVWEHRPLLPPTEVEEGTKLRYTSVHHEMTVILNPWCDLAWDFNGRENMEVANDFESDPKAVPYVFLCDAFEASTIRGRESVNSGVWKVIKNNRDTRYHHLAAAELSDGSSSLPELCLDFKKAFALPTAQLYEGLNTGVTRVAIIPRVYREDLMVRFGYFLARVSLDD